MRIYATSPKGEAAICVSSCLCTMCMGRARRGTRRFEGTQDKGCGAGAAALRRRSAGAGGGDRAAVGRALAAAARAGGRRLFLPRLRRAGAGGTGDRICELAALPQAARRRRRKPHDRGEHRAAPHPGLPDRADHDGRQLCDHRNPAMGRLGAGDQPQRRADARLDRAAACRRRVAGPAMDRLPRASGRHRRDHPACQRRQYRQHLPRRGGRRRQRLRPVAHAALHADRAVLHLSRRRRPSPRRSTGSASASCRCAGSAFRASCRRRSVRPSPA